MATGEFYYLVLCIAVFGVFGATLAYNSWNWRRSRAIAKSALEPAAYVQPPAQKLAA